MLQSSQQCNAPPPFQCTRSLSSVGTQLWPLRSQNHDKLHFCIDRTQFRLSLKDSIPGWGTGLLRGLYVLIKGKSITFILTYNPEFSLPLFLKISSSLPHSAPLFPAVFPVTVPAVLQPNLQVPT